MSNTNCAVQGCKVTVFKKPFGVNLHSCPTSSEMRNKWLHALKNRCTLLDWSRSKICSKHFERKYFDSNRRLKDNAIPTQFSVANKHRDDSGSSRNKLDLLLMRRTQSELIADIRAGMKRVKDPVNIDSIVVSEDLRCRPDASMEAHLWLLLKKQDHLNNRLLNNIATSKKQIEMLKKSGGSNSTDPDQNLETYKYIVKSLQEKLATLEEQIEILTSVESR